MQRLHVKKNDVVQVLTGRSKGKTGRVLRVIPEKSRALVENINMVYEHVRPNPQKNIKGGIVKKEAAIHVSNLMLVCPSCKKPSRTGHVVLPDGKKTRVCKKCQVSID